MNKQWVIFDMDDVLVNLRNAIHEAIRLRTGIDKHWRDWDQYNLSKVYNIPMEEIMASFHEHDILSRCSPEPDAVYVSQRLHEMGFSVGVLSARGWHPRGTELTEERLMLHGFHVDQINLVRFGEKKSDALHAFHGETRLFVDDNIDNVHDVSSAGVKSLLQDRPWNQNEKRFVRIHRLGQVFSHLTQEAVPEFSV